MNCWRNVYFKYSLAGLLVALFSQLALADDACAPSLINPPDAAATCQAVCTAKFGPTSKFNGQWNNSSPTCHWFWSGQYGVCGCTPRPPCRCEGERQTAQCTEPSKCSSNCDCAEGRSCANGSCVDGYFCGNQNKYCPVTKPYCGPSGWCQSSGDCCSACWTNYTWQLVACAGGPGGACRREVTNLFLKCKEGCNCPP